MVFILLDYFKKQKNKVLILQNQINNKKFTQIKRNKINSEFYSIANYILFYLILFLLLEQTISDTTYEHYIIITVNQQEEQQPLSDEYKGVRPAIFPNAPTSSTITLEWDKTITDFSHMFSNLKNIDEVYIHHLLGIHSIFSFTFSNCVNLKKITIDEEYNRNSAIKDMSGMFYNCQSLTSFSFNNLYLELYDNYYNNLYNNIDMSYMFYNCTSLKFITRNNNRDFRYISDMSYMFYNCISLTSINLEKFLTRETTYIDLSYMFFNCHSLRIISFKSSFATKDIKYMFYNCSELSQVNIGDLDIKSSSFLNMSYLFYNCQKLTDVGNIFNNIKINDAREMFYNCFKLTSIYFNPIETINDINMTKMFYNCRNLEKINWLNNNGNNYNGYNNYFMPNDMSYMFYNCKSLTSLDLNKFRTNNVQYMSYMLYNCSSLNSFSKLTNKFNNTNIINMRGLFQNCKSIETLDLTNFYTPNVEIMWDMFNGCNSLINLIIPNFDTSKVIDMQSMFSGCKNLVSLNLSHFNTTNVIYINQMFENCENLKILNLSQLTSDKFSSMYRMFYNCKNLEYLNIFNLIEDELTITEMFEKTNNHITICIKEKENIPNIYYLIYDNIIRDCNNTCYGLSDKRIPTQNNKGCCTLDEYEYNNECYENCPSKTKIQDSTNICRYFDCNNSYYNNAQNRCIDDIPDGYYLNDTYAKTIDKCHEDCKTCYNGSDGYSTNCLSCTNDNLYLYLGNCYQRCRYGDFSESDGIKKCLCHRKKCKECSIESLKYDLCISCNEEEGYYEKSDDNINISNFKNCYKDPEGYYPNLIKKKYFPSYPSCKLCFPFNTNKTNHFCKSCNEENSYSILDENNSTYMNCYPKCKHYYYFNKSDDYNYTCTNTNTTSCPKEYPYLLENTRQCIESCKDKNKYLFRHTCFENYPNETKICIDLGDYYYCNASCPFERPFEMTETQYCVSNCTIMERYNKLCFTNYEGNRSREVQDMVLSDFKDDIVDTFDYTFIISQNHSLIHEEIDNTYEITSTNFTYQDPRTTFVNISNCIPTLKKYYGIYNNDPFYIFKVDSYVEGKAGPKVEYEVYYHFDSKKLNQLDLSKCEGEEIYIGYYIDINVDELDIYNISSSYYNDICYTYTNSKGTDVTLNDRQIEYINNNNSYCEENCKLSRYDKENKRLICSCEIKFSISMISDIKVNKNELYKYIDLRQMINFNVMKCFNLIFSIEVFKNNIGFYSFFPTIISYIVALFIVCLIEFKRISKQINDIISSKKIMKRTIYKKPESETNSENRNEDEKSFNTSSNNSEVNLDKNKEDKEGKDKVIKDTRKKSYTVFLIGEPHEIINNSKLLKKYKRKKIENIHIVPIHISGQENNFVMKNQIEKNYDLKINKMKREKLTEKQKLEIIEILKYNDNELNDLGYKKAFKYNNRTFCQYYISLLFTKHILFQIFNKRDYNSYSIKVLLLFFNFSSCYVINALFFNDDTMHQIYEDEGEFNFIYQIPQIVYSTLVSYFIDNFTAYLALSEDNIIELKQDKNLDNLNEQSRHINETLKIKFILFFIVNFIFILLFWYYLGCFCAVYKNTQYHLIKDTLISLGIGYITPFGTNLITAFIRINSLKTYTKGNKILFALSRILQNYL